MNIYGDVDPTVDFYIVYSTSNVPYQDWQSELLEFSVKRNSDNKKCQIIRLVSNDSSQYNKTFQLGQDVTFVFTKFTDRLPDNTFLAPMNKAESFIKLSEWWLKQPHLKNDSKFVLLDPDMIWYKPMDITLLPKRGTIIGHPFYDKYTMFPLIINVIDMNKMTYLYKQYSISLYEKHGYHSEMYAFNRALKETNITEIIHNKFGSTAGFESSYDDCYFLHYCQEFKVNGRKIWFKQDYTPDTLQRPYKRPCNWRDIKDKSYKCVLRLLHELIDYQKSPSYITPTVIDIPTNNLDVYLWGISNNEKYIMDNCKYSLNTARKYKLNPKILGLNYGWSRLQHIEHGFVLSRLYLLRDLTMKIKDNRILLIMDGFDTLFNGTKEEILERFYSQNTNLLISSEKAFTYQWDNYKDKYDKINSLYKYLNAGTFIGFSDSIKKMATYCIKMIEEGTGDDRGNDQGLMGQYLYNNLEKKNENKLDSNCSLFWVTTDDNTIFTSTPFYNTVTKSHPIIYHVVGGRREYERMYIDTYTKIMKI